MVKKQLHTPLPFFVAARGRCVIQSEAAADAHRTGRDAASTSRDVTVGMVTAYIRVFEAKRGRCKRAQYSDLSFIQPKRTGGYENPTYMYYYS